MPTCLITSRITGAFTGSVDAFAAWTAWFERMGGILADRGTPAFTRTTVGSSTPRGRGKS